MAGRYVRDPDTPDSYRDRAGSGAGSSYKKLRGVAQLVACYVRDVEAAGSSPVTPTIKLQNVLFCVCTSESERQ